ncbi:MAG: CapA family protein, partial [Deltaproteobacteria bacterium]|nr:CapA family protein [Deltaproteobacteria bacterium]
MIIILLVVFGIVGALLLKKKLQYSRPLPDIKRWSILDYIYTILKVFRPVIKAEKDKGIETFFANQDLDFFPPDGFQPTCKLSITAGGDIMHSYGYDKKSLSHIWDDVGDYLFSGDIVFANLEIPVDLTRPPKVLPRGNKLSDFLGTEAPKLNGSDVSLDIFLEGDRHLDIVSTASNHSLNMGKDGLFNTLELLDSKNILHVGTSKNPNEQDNIPIIEKNSIKVAFLAYTFSLNQDSIPEGEDYLANFLLLNEPDTDISLIKRHIDISRKRGADVIVASLHWGYDLEAYPTQNIIDRGHEILEAGVDIILGHHPHMLQPMEKYRYIDPVTKKEKAGFIAYSLSELMSFEHCLPITWLSCILRLEISKGKLREEDVVRLTDVKMLPFYKLCRQNKDGTYEFRQIDLRKTLNNLLYYKKYYNLTTQE